MSVKITAREGTKLTIEATFDIGGSMLQSEESIQKGINQVGSIVTREALKRFDTDGTAIKIGNIKLFSKGEEEKTYQTPYGPIELTRHVYQSSKGGKTYCPLEVGARVIRTSTPCFAKMISSKYSHLNAQEVANDLEENHGRKTLKRLVQETSNVVGTIALAKEEVWEYDTPMLDNITTVVVSLDGAFLLMKDEGFREAMVGNVSLYDNEGERQHSIYIGETPEYGKVTFMNRLTKEVEHVKSLYPNALYIGIADGATSNWNFLEKHTTKHLIDFYHVTEYLSKTAEAAFPKKEEKQNRIKWLKDKCHQLKHEKNAALEILGELKRLSRKRELRKEIKENLSSAITYFTNRIPRMNYWEHVENNLPIGSGVTEAACKTLVKQRLCCSGMRWKNKGAKMVLSLRALIQTKGRWQQFWSKIDQYGILC